MSTLNVGDALHSLIAQRNNLRNEVRDLKQEVKRLRSEGSERGWYCDGCRSWVEPYRPEDSDSVIPYKKCPTCIGGVMLAWTKAAVERNDMRRELEEIHFMLLGESDRT